MSGPRQEWPLYPIGPKETIYAIGVVSLIYTRLESAFRLVFAAVSEIALPHTEVIFARTQNDARMKMMEEMLGRRNLPDELTERVGWFSDGYMICADNRNAIMHSNAVFDAMVLSRMSDTDPLHLMKFSKTGRLQECEVSLEDLRNTADDMQTYTNFGVTLSANIPAPFELPHVSWTMHWPLPDKPPEPRKLRFQPHTSGQEPPSPPRSSPA